MSSSLEGAILGQLAVHHPEPVEAFDMFMSMAGCFSSMDEFAESLKCLTDEGLVRVTNRSGLRLSLSLTEEGLEFVLRLTEEALQIVRAVGNVAEA